ncbi:MAG: hypothetical protein L6461_06660 [Anaerolineae bacterium]|nr:hypothetical protein [Anaerolineae bacterium]
MKRNKEIVISPTRIVTILIVSLMLVTASFIIVPRIPNLFAQEPIGMTAEAAARAGAEAFLSVDAKAGKAAWVDKICQVSTLTGCKATSEAFAPMLWPSVEKKNLRLECKAAYASQVMAIQEPSEVEIWELKTVCSNPDSGEKNNSTTQVIVSKTSDAGWKFERIRFDQENKQ